MSILGLLRLSRRKRRRKVFAVRFLARLEFLDGSFVILEPDMGGKTFRLSSLVASVLLTFPPLSQAGKAAEVDGAILVVSSNPSVLAISAVEGVVGKYRAEVVGLGSASISVSGDADLGDGVQTIESMYDFEVYDGENVADHFDIVFGDVIHKVLPPVADAAAADPAVTGAGVAAVADPAVTGAGVAAVADPAATGDGVTAAADPAATGSGVAAAADPAATGAGVAAAADPAATGAGVAAAADTAAA